MSTETKSGTPPPLPASPKAERTHGPGAGFAGPIVIVLTALALIGCLMVLVHGLVAFWPQAEPTAAAVVPGSALPAAAAPTPALFLFWDLNVSREARLFAVVAFAGALGGTIHGLRSLSWYVGTRDLQMSWLPSYVMFPFVGAGMGLLLYIVLRAGLISPQGDAETLSPYGFAAVAGLIGIFSEQGASKLKDVFEVLFTAAPKESNAQLELKSVEPETGEVGAKVTIRGEGFDNDTIVKFNGTEGLPHVVSSKELRVLVPSGAKTGPVTVQKDGHTVNSKKDFEVTA